MKILTFGFIVNHLDFDAWVADTADIRERVKVDAIFGWYVLKVNLPASQRWNYLVVPAWSSPFNTPKSARIF